MYADVSESRQGVKRAAYVRSREWSFHQVDHSELQSGTVEQRVDQSPAGHSGLRHRSLPASAVGSIPEESQAGNARYSAIFGQNWSFHVTLPTLLMVSLKGSAELETETLCSRSSSEPIARV